MSLKKLFAIGIGLTLCAHTAEAQTSKVLPPFAYIQYCVHHASDCKDSNGRLSTTSGNKVQLTSELRQQLKTVNSEVNSGILPRERRRGDPWTMGGSFGDCNSYALTKRAKLIAQGWPSRALSLTVVKTAWGEGHLVLSVHTSGGVMVLDNLSHNVHPLSQASYKLIAMQGRSTLQWSDSIENAERFLPKKLPKPVQFYERVEHGIPAVRNRSNIRKRSNIVDVADSKVSNISQDVAILSEVLYPLAVD